MIRPSDELEELERIVPLLSAALDQRRLGFALEQAIKATQRVDLQMKRLAALTRTVEILGIQISGSETSDIREVIADIEALGNLMATAVDSAQVERVTRDCQDLEREITRFHRAVAGMVERFRSTNFAPLTSLGHLLVRMGQVKLGARFQQVDLDAANAVRGSALEWPAKLEALRSASESLKKELNQLAGHPEVDEFLIAVGSGRPSLRLVTPAVLKWLEEHDALDRFCVISS